MIVRWLKQRREAAEQVLTDADLLMKHFGEDAYAEARQRARNELAGLHWSKVRREIGRRTGRRYIDTATRYLEP